MRNTYYHENICKSLLRDVDVESLFFSLCFSPFLVLISLGSLFRPTSFRVQSLFCPGPLFAHSSLRPSSFLAGRCATTRHRPGIRYMRGSLCFMANCFIIFDIFPVYGRGSTFCFMVVYCAWWTLLYVPPWILGLRSARVLSARYSRRIEYDKRHSLVIKNVCVFVCCRVSPREKKRYASFCLAIKMAGLIFSFNLCSLLRCTIHIIIYTL